MGGVARDGGGGGGNGDVGARDGGGVSIVGEEAVATAVAVEGRGWKREVRACESESERSMSKLNLKAFGRSQACGGWKSYNFWAIIAVCKYNRQ